MISSCLAAKAGSATAEISGLLNLKSMYSTRLIEWHFWAHTLGVVLYIVAMWIANVIFGVVGVLLLWRVESTTDTSRGGGLRDWWADRKARAALRAEEAAERGAERGAAKVSA